MRLDGAVDISLYGAVAVGEWERGFPDMFVLVAVDFDGMSLLFEGRRARTGHLVGQGRVAGLFLQQSGLLGSGWVLLDVSLS